MNFHRSNEVERLTRSDDHAVKSGDTALAVRIGENLHAIPIAAVEEVLPALPVESLPECPPFIRGVVFVRGHLIPVLDAAERLGMTGHQRPSEPHIICLRVDGRLVGVEVDEALDLIDLGAGTRLDAGAVGARAGFFDAVIELDEHVLRLLNPERLLSDEEVAKLEELPRKR